VAEAVLTGKQVEEFAAQQVGVAVTLVNAKFAWLAKYFLVCDGPGYASDRKGEQE
jgi:hypothetical protein